ncbi:MAG: glycosyltransferase [Verrucomicrobiota bacterium]
MTETTASCLHFWSPDYSKTGGVQRFSKTLICETKEILGADRVRPIQFRPNFGFIGKLMFTVQCFLQILIWRPDVIIITHLHLARLYSILKRFKIKYRIILHGIEGWNLKHSKDIHALTHAERIYCVSNYTREKLCTQLPDLREKVSIFPNHITSHLDQRRLESSSSVAHAITGSPIILSVSRLSKSEAYKGHREFISILPKLIEDFPKLRYIIVGEGDDLPALRELTKSKNLQKFVEFTGYLDDIALNNIYKEADLFALPGYGEGFGIVYLEAALNGLPSLGSIHDGSGDALHNGELGVLTDPKDPVRLESDTRRLIEEVLAKKAQWDPNHLSKRVIELFGPDALRRRTLELISV